MPPTTKTQSSDGIDFALALFFRTTKVPPAGGQPIAEQNGFYGSSGILSCAHNMALTMVQSERVTANNNFTFIHFENWVVKQ
jgi:hypothetical protein